MWPPAGLVTQLEAIALHSKLVIWMLGCCSVPLAQLHMVWDCFEQAPVHPVLASYPEAQASGGSVAPSCSSSWRVPEYGGFQVGSPSVTGQSDSMVTEEGMSQMFPMVLFLPLQCQPYDTPAVVSLLFTLLVPCTLHVCPYVTGSPKLIWIRG